MKLEGRSVLVVGMERSGVASARLLLEHGARVICADQRPLENLGEPAHELAAQGVPFVLQQDGGFDRFDLAVLSPGVPADAPEVLAARDVIGEVELASAFLRGPVVGITGSNGKTTTTAMTGHILAECGVSAQVGGNIGTPVTAMVASSRDDQWNILELSSFQLETTREFRPAIAVILNITQNHLDRHYTMERYADAKARLLDRQRESDVAVLNADDPWSETLERRGSARRIWFSSSKPLSRGASLLDGVLSFDGYAVLPANALPLRGLHNVENALAALTAAHLAGAPLSGIGRALRSFHAVEHRLEFVRRFNGVDYYNDSKATSVDATLKALSAFDHGLWVILGGKDKGSNYTPLREPLGQRARAALLVGAAADKIASHLAGALPLIAVGDLAHAVAHARAHAVVGDTVLLAPACSSFDQFSNYEERGECFKQLVWNLEGERHGATPEN